MLTPRRPGWTRRLLLLAALPGWLALPSASSAEPRPRSFSEQPAYVLELEPHFVAGVADAPGPAASQGGGLGVRGSSVVSRDGFIATANDSIAVGFGIDVLRYPGQTGSLSGTCVRRTPGPGGTSVCTEVDVPGSPRNYVFLSGVMQWNFWLTPRWSLFGEPGIDLFLTNHGSGAAPSLAVGGRMHFSDFAALTLRLGWPLTTLGVSFLL